MKINEVNYGDHLTKGKIGRKGLSPCAYLTDEFEFITEVPKNVK